MKKFIFTIFIITTVVFLAVGCKSLNPKQMACDKAGDTAFNECMGDSTNAAKKVGCEVARQKAVKECMDK